MSNYDYYGNDDSWTVIIQKENDFESIRTQASIKEIKDLLSAFIRKDNAIDLAAYRNNSNAAKFAEVSFSRGVLYAEGVERNGHIVRYTAVNENYVQDFKCKEYTAYVEEQSESSEDRYVVKPLTSKDLESAELLDEMSGFELQQWVETTEENDDPFAWGIFEGNILAGYCSIGYADDTCSEIEEHPLHDSDSLLLSDVYVVPNYRHQGLAEKMVKTAIQKRWELDGTEKPVFLVCISDRVAALYEKIGFTRIQKKIWNGAMVLVPEKGEKKMKKKNLKIFTDIVEQEAIDQIDHLLEQPAFQNCKVRIMPDVHSGKGCVIGFTANLGDKVIPNIVGVDIGCGMLTVKLDAKSIDFDKLDKTIREFIPSGRETHETPKAEFHETDHLFCLPHLKDIERVQCSIGTLGGGNHFIEVDRGQDGNLYLVIHTGSRNLGKQVAEYYQDLAYNLTAYNEEEYDAERKALIAEYKRLGKVRELPDALKKLKADAAEKAASVDRDLCYLEGEEREHYLHDMKICQDYAKLNRKLIADTILEKMGISEIFRFETVHNYIDHRSNIVRKGAISARRGELLLIPVSMKDGCILGQGKGSEDWNCSAPHGAGRLMSRSKAKKKLTVAEFAEEMAGIYTTCVSEETLDEAPMAYKPLESIVGNISETVEVLEIIKPIYNFKAG